MRVATYFCAVLLLTLPVLADSVEEWAKTENAAAAASKSGRFQEAEQLLHQNEKFARTFPLKDARRPRTLLDLAHVYRAERKYSEALARYERAQPRSGQAEDAYRQSASMLGKTLGGDHPDYANAIEHLALVCEARKDFDTAEPLPERVLEIRKKAYGPEHRDVATSLEDLAGLKRAENRPREAADLYEQSLAMLEKIVGPDSPDLAPDLNNLAAIYEITAGKQQRAEQLFVRAVALDEKALGPDSPDLATDLNNLGLLYLFTKRYQLAADTLGRALAIRRKAFGDSDPLVKESAGPYDTAMRALKQIGRN